MFSKVFATDLQPSRLALAERHGATALPLPDLRKALLEATGGRGADAVLEVVGVEGAVRTGMELVRPYGVLSSVGVHGAERKLDGDLLYGKKYVLLQSGYDGKADDIVFECNLDVVQYGHSTHRHSKSSVIISISLALLSSIKLASMRRQR
jgi:threonine dehydrogenase-like Zn-dependent dehydrogenase